MSKYIPQNLRSLVAERAGNCCEYCGLPAEFSFFTFHIDHIISQKHGGETILENLAYACSICNEFKGSDIATILDDQRKPILLFNPRLDNWHDHFELDDLAQIIAKTPTALANIKLLNLNHPDSIIERRELIHLRRLKER